MKISDTVAGIIYRNDETGYTVIRLENSGGTAVGFFPFLTEGADCEFTGEYVTSAKYGKQFKVVAHEQKPPTTPDKIKQFIGSGLIPGIGPATAGKIVATFGADTLAVMEHRPEELTVVKGINLKKAEAIAERFAEIKEMQKSVSFLQRFDISLNMAIRIFGHYKDDTIAQVQQNPYQLIEKIDGIGFLTADKMARELGISYAGKFRVRAGIVYVLKTAAEAEGHTCMPDDKLFMGTMRLLKIKAETLRPIFDGVVDELCIDKYLSKTDQMLALTKFYKAEKGIAEKLNLLQTVTKRTETDADLLSHYEKVNKIQLHETQRDAINLATSNGVTVITGGPGTGKTTIIRAILFICESRHQKVQLLAPTGRAAKRLEETTGMPASTIHRALDIDYKNYPGPNGKAAWHYDDPNNVLRADVVIVDEVSMCDSVLMNQLLQKVLPGTRVVLVGDIDQLASVGAGNVLSDIIGSGKIHVIRLTEIYRQDPDSKIVESAHAINCGQMPDLRNKSKDFFFVKAETQSEIKRLVLEHVTTRLPKYNPSRAQVLCPMKAGEAGMTSLNLALQDALNPKSDDRPEYIYGDNTYRLGDRVMQVANDYAREWTKWTEAGLGVYNGDIGEITEVASQSGEVRVRFEDGRESTYTRSELSSLVPSYAITVHKSQGCEFDVVVIPVTSGAYMVLTRNLLYTAVTRAKSLVMLVGSIDNIQKMVENTYTKQRYTMLGHFL
ncbi:MAG: ATP-dependent RecD-like DNA helicase [Christensenellaceae bacterium]|jgi:exodeoxyribonuclease V alpha subunit|nr:ATP-dependent RecD-like DNA helicase [Christensenellaceae bacterium]